MDFDSNLETITPNTLTTLTIGSTGGVVAPSGTTAQRPGSPVSGTLRYNTTTSLIEIYQNGIWINIGSTVPAGVSTNIQFNNGGIFGGTSNFNYVAGTNPQVNCIGTAATTQLAIGSPTPTNTNVTLGSNNSTVFIEVPADTISEGLRVYFHRSTAGISGWITYDYDGAAPNIRLTDEDDDPPYIQFNTIGTGTYLLPLYTSLFGGRGPAAGRTTGFEWKLGTNTADWSAASTIMLMDTQFLTLPGGSFNGAAATGTTANRPTPASGMIRYNGTLNRFESYEQSAWLTSSGVLDKSTTSVTATTAAATTLFTFSVPGNTLNTDGILRLTMNGSFTVGGTGRTCTITISYGGTTMWTDTTATVTNGLVMGWSMDLMLAANNSANAQTLSGNITLGTPGAPTTGTAGNFAAALNTAPTATTNILGSAAFASAGAGTFLVQVSFSGTVTGFIKNIHILEKL